MTSQPSSAILQNRAKKTSLLLQAMSMDLTKSDVQDFDVVINAIPVPQQVKKRYTFLVGRHLIISFHSTRATCCWRVGSYMSMTINETN